MLRLKVQFAKSRSLLRPVLRAGRVWRRAALLVITLGVLLVMYWPAQAAMELLFFRAESTNTSVLLSWATSREINVEGYKILCKRQIEPESAYHVIGTRMATGGPNQGAVYSFDVTTNVYFGEQYCFRLEEVTTDGLPGEKFDICGYGPGVTPTPDTTPVAAQGATTPLVVQPPPNFTPPPTLITPTIPGFPGATSTPIGGISPLDTPMPTPTIFGTIVGPAATLTQPFSPLETPMLTPTIFGTIVGPVTTPTQPFSPLGTLTPTFTPTLFGAVATPLATVTQPLSPLVTPTASAAGFPVGEATPTGMPSTVTDTPAITSTVTVAVTPTSTPAAPTATATVLAAEAPPGTGGGGISQPAEAAPTQMYIVVTATPTPEALAAAPSLTPLPTATPTPDIGLLSVLTPTAQNMMIMLLCLIFLSATGLGTLGLVTTVLYLRSQSQRRAGADDFTRRRRL